MLGGHQRRVQVQLFFCPQEKGNLSVGGQKSDSPKSQVDGRGAARMDENC